MSEGSGDSGNEPARGDFTWPEDLAATPVPLLRLVSDVIQGMGSEPLKSQETKDLLLWIETLTGRQLSRLIEAREFLPKQYQYDALLVQLVSLRDTFDALCTLTMMVAIRDDRITRRQAATILDTHENTIARRYKKYAREVADAAYDMKRNVVRDIHHVLDPDSPDTSASYPDTAPEWLETAYEQLHDATARLNDFLAEYRKTDS